MAWQTPKTDWTGVDGVRDTDLNRIEGNILELYHGIASADLFLYVSTSGNDNTGTGTGAAPFRTIAKALSTIPRNLNGRSAAISIAAGAYFEDVVVKNYEAPIILTGGQTVSINSFSVDGCCCILANNTNILSRGIAQVTNGGVLTGVGTLTTEGANVLVNYGSTLSLDQVVCNNSPGFAIAVDGASRFNGGYLNGNGNANGLSAQGGSVLTYGDINMEIDGVIFFTAMGGRIYSGSQPQSQLP